MRLLAAAKALAATILVASLAGCVSTGNAKHPYRTWTLHEWAFGHQRYTPEERVEARCRYRNRLPGGARTGFSRQCRLEAAEKFGMGINAAMYGTLCVIEKCREVAYAADYRAEVRERKDDEMRFIKRHLCRAERALFSDEVGPFRAAVAQAVAARPAGDLAAYVRAVDEAGRVSGIYWAHFADRMQAVPEVGLDRCVASWDGPS